MLVFFRRTLVSPVALLVAGACGADRSATGSWCIWACRGRAPAGAEQPRPAVSLKSLQAFALLLFAAFLVFFIASRQTHFARVVQRELW